MSQAVARVWADDLAWVSLPDAVEAARLHYRETDKWLMPAHVIQNVKRAAETRLPPRREVTAADCSHVFKGGFCVFCPTKDPTWGVEG